MTAFALEMVTIWGLYALIIYIVEATQLCRRGIHSCHSLAEIHACAYSCPTVARDQQSTDITINRQLIMLCISGAVTYKHTGVLFTML